MIGSVRSWKGIAWKTSEPGASMPLSGMRWDLQDLKRSRTFARSGKRSSDENQQLRDQMKGLQADLSSDEGLARALAERDEELRGVRSEAEELKRQRDSELAAKIEELERLASLRHGDAAEVEELRQTLARRNRNSLRKPKH